MLTFRSQDRAALADAGARLTVTQLRLLQQTLAAQAVRINEGHLPRARALAEQMVAALAGLAPQTARPGESAAMLPAGLGGQALAYWRDLAERSILLVDLLRERAVQDAAHEAAGTPPVLVYDYEVVMDGQQLERPSNYMLLRILPPEGVTVDPARRPFIIIDPRAGHGAGIGGFKLDSQVGVALKAGHPVYFVAFRPHPVPGQTLADVMRTEAAFVRRVHALHPEAGAPVIVGNCQGGWASLLLAAANPDLTGPVIVNGAPVATWSGRVGENPMRYNGGLFGGILPALMLADLNNGELDGANLVLNFELLNPSRNFVGKYYDVWQDIDSPATRSRFLEFEKWWGGYYFLADEEMRWIVEQLFVGNRLARNEARLERGRQLDLKAIRSPIIVFASHGDNITPPQQALNWIADTYADEREIKVRGQRIIYMVHDKVGHLGIFVSSSVARREHSEITSTLGMIESLTPGLWEMRIDSVEGEGADARFAVSFAERTMADIRAIDDGQADEVPAFAAVSRFSELGAELYDLGARPLVQSMVTPQLADALRQLHPARLSRSMFAPTAPLTAAAAVMAPAVRVARTPLPADHPMRRLEALWMEGVMLAIDAWRDWRDTMAEFSFYALWASPMAVWASQRHSFERARLSPEALRCLPAVERAIERRCEGGYPAAVVRMLVLLANARGSVRRDRLERADSLLERSEPFRSLGAAALARLIHEQTLLVEFDREAALDTLPVLLPAAAERLRALDAVLGVAGAHETLDDAVAGQLREMLRRLDLPEPAGLGAGAPVAPGGPAASALASGDAAAGAAQTAAGPAADTRAAPATAPAADAPARAEAMPVRAAADQDLAPPAAPAAA